MTWRPHRLEKKTHNQDSLWLAGIRCEGLQPASSADQEPTSRAESERRGTMAFTFAAFCYMLALLLTAALIFFAIWHVSTLVGGVELSECSAEGEVRKPGHVGRPAWKCYASDVNNPRHVWNCRYVRPDVTLRECRPCNVDVSNQRDKTYHCDNIVR